MMDLSQLSDEELLAMKQNKTPVGSDLTDEIGIVGQGIAGAAKGLHNVYRHGGNMIGLISDEEISKFDQINSEILQQPAAKAGSFIGEVLGAAPIGAGAAGIIGKGVSSILPKFVAGSGVVGQGIGRGAIEGGIESAMVGGDPMAGGGIGAAVGGAIPGVGRLWKGVARPARPSRAALEIERLGDQQGIDIGLTAGQLVDDSNFTGSLIKGIENTIDRVPGAGAILHAKQQSMANWNRAEIRNALPVDLAESITTSGQKGIEQARQAVKRGYSDVLDDIKVGDITITDNALDELAGVEQYAVNRVAPDQASGVQKDVNNLLDDLMNNRLDGKNIKELESSFGKKIRSASNKGNIDVAESYRGMLDILRRQRNETVGPEGAARLQEIDSAYAKLMPIVDASAMKGAVSQGYFTPSQLLSGGQKGQSQWGKATARNPLSKRALAADDVFGSTVPNMGPGTAEKLAAQSILGGAAGVAGDLMSGGSGGLLQSGLLGASAAPMMGAMLPYLRDPLLGRTSGQAMMRGMQHPLDQILSRVSPYAIAPAVLGLQE